MGSTRKVSIQKALEICTKMVYEGKVRKDIVQFFVSEYRVSESAVDKWIRKARPMAQELIDADAAVFRAEAEKQTKEKVTALNLTKADLVDRYHKIAFGDVRRLYGAGNTLRDISELTEEEAAMLDTIDVMEETDRKGNVIGYTRKIKRNSSLAALDKLAAMLGYNAPAKTTFTDENGNPLPTKISLNLG